MSGASTEPMHVSAKVILEETRVPSLTGRAFNRDAVLEKGIHVHWALPDNMTHAKLLPKGGGDVVMFPGVPDLWLVIRFNPGPPIGVDAKRTWRAWVVDSVAQRADPLDTWVAPTSRDPKSVHTVAGVLPTAADVGHPGYGIWRKDDTKFDPAMAAYYPESRARFGFYDALEDLSGTGAVSYVIIGWFAEREHDPLYLAGDRLGLLNYRKTAHNLRSDVFDELCTAVSAPGVIADKPAFAASSIGVHDLNLAAGKELDFAKASARGGALEWVSTQADAMGESCPVAAGTEKMEVAASSAGPTYTIVHGYLYEAPLGGPTTLPGDIKDEDIRLFPSVRRAMAELAAMNIDDEEQVDAVEMLLDDLASMKSSVSGVIDMPGMAHAATFQSVPGKSRWYARIEIQPKEPVCEAVSAFGVGKVAVSSHYEATGHWPKILMRSASNTQDWMAQDYPPDSTLAPILSEPHMPSSGEQEAWRESVRAAFDETIKAAEKEGKEIDPNLVNVVDRRSDAQPSTIGKTEGRGGSDGAGWWVDVKHDDSSLNELLRCAEDAKVVLPTGDNLLEIPGPRWNRPWSPQLVLFGTGRSFKFGFDNRFDNVDGYLKTRASGETTTGLAVGSNQTVFGKDIMENPSALFSKPGLPPEARGLVSEALLFDTESASVMARLALGVRGASNEALAATQKQMKSAIRGLWLARDEETVSAVKPNLAAVAAYGTLPSEIAYSPWQNPRDPLFVDVNYAHPHSSLAEDWTLEQDCVEMRSKKTQGTNPPAGQVEVIEERARVTASVVNVLTSALVTRTTLDLAGDPIVWQKPPKDLNDTTFTKMDVISAPLTSLDSTLTGLNYRERSGALRLNRLELVDMFGLARGWDSGIGPASPDGGAKLSYWTELAPRLPYWARLMFRFQQAQAPDKEANPLAHPVCGILVPDFVEHAVEVFDGYGKALGQLTTDRPRLGEGPGSEGASLQTTFELHPWYAAERNLGPGSNPLDGIDNPTLRSLVESLTVQGVEMPDNAGKGVWFETGMSAMLRCIDTIRATLDPSKVTDDKRIKLLGEPILVLAARLSYQATASTNPAELAHDPPLLDAPPAMPVLTVRVGDSTRPDDGTLGCFIEAKTSQGSVPSDGRFAPVTKEAAERAIVNGLSMGVPYLTDAALKVTHPFVAGQESVFQLQAGETKDIIILADPRGGLYATCGALPRKKITMPTEFIQASLKHLEPTFRVGPIFTTRTLGSVKALAPPPEIEGLDVEYVYRKPGGVGEAETFPEVSVPPVPPVGELPTGRVVLTDGWMRVFKPEES